MLVTIFTSNFIPINRQVPKFNWFSNHIINTYLISDHLLISSYRKLYICFKFKWQSLLVCLNTHTLDMVDLRIPNARNGKFYSPQLIRQLNSFSITRKFLLSTEIWIYNQSILRNRTMSRMTQENLIISFSLKSKKSRMNLSIAFSGTVKKVKFLWKEFSFWIAFLKIDLTCGSKINLCT